MQTNRGAESGDAVLHVRLLHQLCLVYVCNPALQLLRMLREELEFGAVTLRMLPRVVIADLSWRTDQKNQSSTCLEVFGLNKSSTRHQLCSCQHSGAPASRGRPNMPRIICVPSCHAALPRMTLMLIFLCKEELTRQPIFNSSAPP